MTCECNSRFDALFSFLQEIKTELGQVKGKCQQIEKELFGISNAASEEKDLVAVMETTTVRQIIEKLAFDLEWVKREREEIKAEEEKVKVRAEEEAKRRSEEAEEAKRLEEERMRAEAEIIKKYVDELEAACRRFGVEHGPGQKVDDNGSEERDQDWMAKLAKTKIPDLRDLESVEYFSLSEVQLGETLLSTRDMDGALEHLGYALVADMTSYRHRNPDELLQMFQGTLPPQMFRLLLQRLPKIGMSLHTRHLASFGAAVGSSDSSQGSTQ